MGTNRIVPANVPHQWRRPSFSLEENHTAVLNYIEIYKSRSVVLSRRYQLTSNHFRGLLTLCQKPHLLVSEDPAPCVKSPTLLA